MNIESRNHWTTYLVPVLISDIFFLISRQFINSLRQWMFQSVIDVDSMVLSIFMQPLWLIKILPRGWHIFHNPKNNDRVLNSYTSKYDLTLCFRRLSISVKYEAKAISSKNIAMVIESMPSWKNYSISASNFQTVRPKFLVIGLIVSPIFHSPYSAL